MATDTSPVAIAARRFQLVRDVDVTGVSGTGRVTEGLEFSDGQVAMRWLTSVSSIAFYHSIGDVLHIHGHDGNTRLEWIDN